MFSRDITECMLFCFIKPSWQKEPLLFFKCDAYIVQAATWWGETGHHLTVYADISLTLFENKLFCKYFSQFTAASLARVKLGSHREAGCTAYKKGQALSFSKLKIYFNSLSKRRLPAPRACGSCFSEVLLMFHLQRGALSQGQLRM